MRRITYPALFVIFLIPAWNTWAQADINLATHWYNHGNYNPASIARTDYLHFFSNLGQQWIGIEGAPRVFNIQASEYINSWQTAFGISLVGDRVGVTQVFNPMLNYAYRISNDDNWSLALGLSGGIFARSVNGALFEPETEGDPSILYDINRKISPDANVGFVFRISHFTFSISSTHLFSIFKSDSSFLNSNHRYASVFYENDESELFSYFAGLQIVNRYNLTILEGHACIRFKQPTGLLEGPKDLFDIGLTVRTSRQMTFLFGLNINPDLRIGYAYNQSFIAGYYPNGTHEIMIDYRIPNRVASTE